MAPKLKKKIKKVAQKLDIPNLDIQEFIKYEKIKHSKPVLDVNKIKLKKKKLGLKINLDDKKEDKKSDKEKPKEEAKKPEEKETEEFSSPSVFESASHASTPIIKERERKEEPDKPVKNMETFLERLPTSEKKEEKPIEERYSARRTVQYDYGTGGVRYEKRDEWTDNQDFHDATRRVVLLDSPTQRRARTVRHHTIDRDEFTDTGIAKYEIIKENKEDLNKYRRRRV